MFCKFIFDGISSDEYGLVCVHFEDETIKKYASQQTDLSYEKSIYGDSYHIISQQYQQPTTYTLQVINRNKTSISQEQERAINKWLCQRNTFKPFSVYHKRYADICFFANISNPQAIFINDVNGLEFTVTTNSSIAFSNERNNIYEFKANDAIQFYVDNDEEIPIYPDIIITALESGNFEIKNKTLDEKVESFTIDNVSENEVITITAKYPIIESSDTVHNKNIYNDSNKEWLYFIDGYNTIQVNKACKIQFIYREYRKVGII